MLANSQEINKQTDDEHALWVFYRYCKYMALTCTHAYSANYHQQYQLTFRFDMCLNTNGLEMAIYKHTQKDLI